MISKLKTQKFKVILEDWSFVKVEGRDSRSFLNGQLTQNFSTISPGKPAVTCRLDLKGKISFASFVLDESDGFRFLLPKEKSAEFIQELDKFVIMEDVAFMLLDETPCLALGLPCTGEPNQLTFYNTPAVLCDENEDLKTFEMVEELRRAAKYPDFFAEETYKKFINETIFNEVGIDYNKGCFYGQEIVSKIEVGRGGAKYPVHLQSDDDLGIAIIKNENRVIGDIDGIFQFNDQTYYMGNLLRDYRVNSKEYDVHINDQEARVQVFTEDLWNWRDPKKIAYELFLQSTQLSLKNDDKKALELMKIAYKVDPSNEDITEAYGVMLEKQGFRDSAIEHFENMKNNFPHSVMAHTNLSLIFMRDGKIDKAEEEKGKATVKSFQMAGKEAKSKREEEAQREKELADIQRREIMFNDVLQIDANDELANYGLAEIMFMREEYQSSEEKLRIVLNTNSKHSLSYLLLGKTLLKLSRSEEARDVLLQGIEIAAKNGDMKPANEMQQSLSKINL